MAIPIPLTTSPIKVSGTKTKPYLITNDPNSANTIYLGTDSSLTTNNYGATLDPGASLTWSEITKEVWAKTATGTANVTVIYEASGTFSPVTKTTILNASIPVSGSVNANITNASLTVAGNVNVTNASIPVSGSVAISSGSVNITSGTVAVSSGNITSAVGNTPGIISTRSVSLATTSSFTTLSLDVSAYASIKIELLYNVTTIASTAQTLTAGAYTRLQFSQTTATVAAIAAITNEAQWQNGDGLLTTLGAPNATQTYQIPVTTKYLNYTGTYQTSTGAPVGTLTINIIGSYETIPNERYQNIYPGGITGLTSGFYDAAAGVLLQDAQSAAGTSNYLIPSYNGRALIMLRNQATATTASRYQLSAYKDGSSYIFAAAALTSFTVAGTSITNDIILPNLPIAGSMITTGAGGLISIYQTR